MGERRVDATLVVSAPAFLQRRRVMARPGMTVERFDGILRQQVPDALKRRKASIVIPTGMGLAPTRAALAKAVAELRGLRGAFLAAQSVAGEIHSPARARASQVARASGYKIGHA